MATGLNRPPENYLERPCGASLGAAEFTAGKKRTFISCDAKPDLQTGIWLSLEVPTCCLEAIRMLHSSYPSLMLLLPQATLNFPPHPTLAVSTSAHLLQCHLELKGPCFCFLLDTRKDIVICLIHLFTLFLKGSRTFLSTTIFAKHSQHDLPVATEQLQPVYLYICIFGLLPSSP